MSVGGRSFPRRLLFGFDVSAAQSSGEWPGSRTTLREEVPGFAPRGTGARVLLERPDDDCGTRREDAAEGGGRRGIFEFVGRGGAGNRPGAGFGRGAA